MVTQTAQGVFDDEDCCEQTPRQVRADSLDVPNGLVNSLRRPSFSKMNDGDPSNLLIHLKGKIIDLEAKLALLHTQEPSASLAGLNVLSTTETAELLPDENVKRKPAKPKLNRIGWLDFKNFYPEEDTFAIDVLMGPAKFYWQRRAEEREMRDRLEAAKTYDAENKDQKQKKEKEKAEMKATNGIADGPKEMPERIRINSQPLLALLADIVDERWDSEPKVMLRPYKLLVNWEDSIRRRLEVLKRIWDKRPKPSDVTVTAGAVAPMYYEPDVDDLASLHEDGASTTSNETRRRLRLDLTTTYDALQDLTCLVKFMDQDVLPVVRQYQADSTHSKIYFRDLWYHYQPGNWVVLDERRGKRFSPDAGADDERPSSQPANLGERATTIWRVLRTADGRPKLSAPNRHERNRQPANEVNPFRVRCYRIDFDGDHFGPIWVDFDIQPWTGEKSIEQLDIVPLRRIKDAAKKKERYVKRGKEFIELTVPQHRVYSGPLLNFHPSGLLFEHVSHGQRDVYGSVIVDFRETARTNPKMIMKLGFPDDMITDEDLTTTEDYPTYVWVDRKAGRWRESVDDIYEDSHIDEHLMRTHIRKDNFLSRYDDLAQGDYISASELSDDDFALLPDRVCAYILQRRRFAILKLECLKPQGPDAQNWDDLFLHRDNKNTVKAQTMSHFRDKRMRAASPDMDFDLSQEKGLGLIILLHGVPGVGKTSTAECVAQLLGKPLFPITCGDLGTTADQVEQQLNEIFSKAEKWDCVLLLDEADVFLASRGKNDLQRNAVVSVFLRILELYTGILFLTTNRIGVLDEAFMSRTHTQLYYPPLEKEQSLKIWETNLKKLVRRKRETIHVDIDRVLAYASDHYQANADKATRWNGRQIRNACLAAYALAEYESFGEASEDQYVAAFSNSSPVVRLDVTHFQKIDAAMHEFNDYMTTVCGEDFSGLARNRMERDDDYEAPRRYADYHYGQSPPPRQTPMRMGPYSPGESSAPYFPTESPASPFNGGYRDSRWMQRNPSDYQQGPQGPPDQRWRNN